MSRRIHLRRRTGFVRGAAAAVCAVGLAAAAPCAAQDDTPKISVGATLFADYTIQQQPRILDADGNTVTLNQFEIGRS